MDVMGAVWATEVKIPESLALFTSTWNANFAVVDRQEFDMWLPWNFDLYVIAVQQCKSVKAVHAEIHEYLGRKSYHAFKFKEIGPNALFVFAKTVFVKAGVLAPSRLNDLVRCEIKGKGLLASNPNGLGAIIMQISFHNTTMAFLAVVLDDAVDGLEKRKQDLDFCLKSTGVSRSALSENGIPELSSVQHVFMMGDFGFKTKGKVSGAAKATWKGKWSTQLLYKNDFEEMVKAVPDLDEFDELPVNYPPTTRRVVKKDTKKSTLPPATAASSNNGKSKKAGGVKDSDDDDGGDEDGSFPTAKSTKELSINLDTPPPPVRPLSPSLGGIFEADYAVEGLYDAKAIKKEGEPSFQDRIFFRTRDEFKRLIIAGEAGSCEGMRQSSHVPVHATFRVVGMDHTLLKRWQVLTGNMPVENASRADTRMVTGVVENLMSELATKDAADAKQGEFRSKAKAEYLKKQKKCDRCMEPLALEGGDVELGERAAFHRQCFTCEDCGKDLMGDKQVFADGRWLCAESFERLFKAPCRLCKLDVIGSRVRVGKDQRSYHLGCFQCRECLSSLQNPSGGLLQFNDLDSEPYCIPCFEKLRGLYCPSCRKFVFEKDERGGPARNFHKACFMCAICNVDMDHTNLKIFVRDYKVYCEIDHLKQLLEEKKKVELARKKEDAEQEEFLAAQAREKEREIEADERRKNIISRIPAGFDINNFDVDDDADVGDDDDDED